MVSLSLSVYRPFFILELLKEFLSICQESSAALEDCLKLLRGERDEQKLAGLLLVTKLIQADDNALVIKVYEAVGTRFLGRLLMTG